VSVGTETQTKLTLTDSELEEKSERQQLEPRAEVIPTVDEKPEYLNELKLWSCICINLIDWTIVYERYTASKKQGDVDLASLLEKNYLEEMPALFAKHEKDLVQRQLAMAPKRQSERLSKISVVNREGNGSNCDESFEDSVEMADDAAVRERIAKQREERLKQRLLRRDMNSENGCDGFEADEEGVEGDETVKENEFNRRNYFLMQKVMAKIMACKYAWPFKNAVLEEDAPDYYNIIEVSKKSHIRKREGPGMGFGMNNQVTWL